MDILSTPSRVVGVVEGNRGHSRLHALLSIHDHILGDVVFKNVIFLQQDGKIVGWVFLSFHFLMIFLWYFWDGLLIFPNTLNTQTFVFLFVDGGQFDKLPLVFDGFLQMTVINAFLLHMIAPNGLFAMTILTLAFLPLVLEAIQLLPQRNSFLVEGWRAN